MKLKPLNDYVVIKPDEADDITSSGILLVTGSDSRPERGIALAVGPGMRGANGDFLPLVVRAGDSVIFSPNSGVTVHVDGVKLIVMHEADVFAIDETTRSRNADAVFRVRYLCEQSVDEAHG